jgi:electron transport complex protein RnfC
LKNLILHHFPGGIHPRDEKSLTEHLPIEDAPIPSRVFIPISQHIGAPAEPLVKPGDNVTVGDKIAEARGFVSANIHASVTGIVRSIKPYPNATGRKATAIEIETRGDNQTFTPEKERKDALSLPPQTLIPFIREAGIVGMGGATFPTHVKLSPPENKPIHTLIINGVECEPFLTADHRLMLEFTPEILEGIQYLRHVLGCNFTYMAIESNKPDAIDLMDQASRGRKIHVISLPMRYPQGAEKQLIKTIVGKEVPSGGLPMDVGTVVQNVGSTFAIYEAIRWGKPLIERVTTVTGRGITTPKNLRIRIGTPVKDILELCGGWRESPGKLILGGPMMGMNQYDDSIPVTKGTSGILLLPSEDVGPYHPHTCIRCGKCVTVCPMGLLPNYLGVFSEHARFTDAERYNLLDCIECGSCTFSCPAKRPLVQLIRYAKGEVLRRRKKAAAK